MKQLVIFGASGFAEMAYYYFKRDSSHDVAAFTVDGAYLKQTTFEGLPVLAFEELGAAFPPDRAALFVAMGMQKVNQQRAKKVAEAESRGYELVSFLSSKAKVADDLVLKPNTFVMEEAYVHPKVTVGRNTIIWPKCLIGFRTRIGDHCWVAAAKIGETVTVGDYTFIGINATITSFRTIGASNIIGAGAVVLEDTPEFSIYKAAAATRSRVPSHRLRRI